jgi:hypothetical protein
MRRLYLYAYGHLATGVAVIIIGNGERYLLRRLGPVLAWQQARAKPWSRLLRHDRAGPYRGSFVDNREDERVAYCSLEEWEA